MADVDCLSPEVTSRHFLSSYTQVGATSNDVTSSPAKTVYIVTQTTWQKISRAYGQHTLKSKRKINKCPAMRKPAINVCNIFFCYLFIHLFIHFFILFLFCVIFIYLFTYLYFIYFLFLILFLIIFLYFFIYLFINLLLFFYLFYLFI